jgi:hypothetical protein
VVAAEGVDPRVREEEKRWAALVYREQAVWVSVFRDAALAGPGGLVHDACRVFLPAGRDAVLDELRGLYDRAGAVVPVAAPLRVGRLALVAGEGESRYDDFLLLGLPRLLVLLRHLQHNVRPDDPPATLLVPHGDDGGGTDGYVWDAVRILSDASVLGGDAPELAVEQYDGMRRAVAGSVAEILTVDWAASERNRRPYSARLPPAFLLRAVRQAFVNATSNAAAAPEGEAAVDAVDAADAEAAEVTIELDDKGTAATTAAAPEDAARDLSRDGETENSTTLDRRVGTIVWVQSAYRGTDPELLEEQKAADLLHRLAAASGDPGRLKVYALGASGWSLERTAILFQHAAVVVGLHGAGLANAIFCQPGAALLEIALQEPSHRRYAQLAAANGLEYWVHTSANYSTAGGQRKFELDHQGLSRVAGKLLGMNSSAIEQAERGEKKKEEGDDISAPGGGIDMQKLAAMLSKQMGGAKVVVGNKPPPPEEEAAAVVEEEVSDFRNDDCDRGWEGEDCLQCAPGFEGSFCHPVVVVELNDGSDDSAMDMALPPEETPNRDMPSANKALPVLDVSDAKEGGEEKGEHVNNDGDGTVVQDLPPSISSDEQVELTAESAGVEEYLFNSRELMASLSTNVAAAQGPVNVGCMENGIYAAADCGKGSKLIPPQQLEALGRLSFYDDQVRPNAPAQRNINTLHKAKM